MTGSRASRTPKSNGGTGFTDPPITRPRQVLASATNIRNPSHQAITMMMRPGYYAWPDNLSPGNRVFKL